MIEDMAGKKRCKLELQKRTGLPVSPNVPLFGLVTRLAWQKGIDIFLDALNELVRLDVNVVILGAGDPELEEAVQNACLRWPEKAAAHVGYSDELAHQIYAGADFFLMPSRYEPCGLGQMYALRYGTLPVVRATGGLEDTVQDYDKKSGTGDGFKFDDLNPRDLVKAVLRATGTYHDRKDHFSSMRRTAMRQRFSWETAAEKYDALYEKAVRRVRRDA
jgi:starch synthase